MKDFFSDLFSFILGIIMWIPVNCVRNLTMQLTLKKFGKSNYIARNVEIRSPYRIIIGSNNNINKNVLLDGRGEGLIIGDNVDIAQETNIWTLQHDYNSPDYNSIGAATVIEDYVWIASRVTILPGVHIGKGAVVAAGAVVTKDIAPFTIVAGVPAKIIGKRSDNLRYKLGKKRWFH